MIGYPVPARLIGVIETEQTEDGQTTRNDRLIAVAADSRNHSHARFVGNLNSNLVHEIERFFISCNETKRKKFTVVGRSGPEVARALIDKSSSSLRGSRTTKKRIVKKKTSGKTKG